MKYCDSEYKNCPYRIIDKEQGRNITFSKGLSHCYFTKKYAEKLYLRDKEGVEQLIKSACPELKNLMSIFEAERKIIRVQVKKFLNSVKIGEKVYCMCEMSDVIFLAKPTTEFGDCKYQTSKGKIKWTGPSMFRTISKGNKFVEFEVKGSKDKAGFYEIIARQSGFRVETIKKEDSFLLKIYGDTQEEVDDFLTLRLMNDYSIDYL